MERMIEELILEIKKDPRYLSFLVQEKRMENEDVQRLLKEYQEAMEDYQEVKAYANHINISKQENRVKELKKEVSKHPIVKDYYQAYYQINDLLEEVTNLVFKDISSQLATSIYEVRGIL
jgi:cell fate (sporulation/competence/biofilm development) regulator YlbF (YheA/YmcA/DUF963 family)